MSKLTETVQTGDWSSEKHVPEIDFESVDNGKVRIRASVGSEIEHPNTLEHHIAWIKVFFKPEGSQFPVEIASSEFTAHGEEDLFTVPCATGYIKADKKGTIYALSYCNIHGLWENSAELN